MRVTITWGACEGGERAPGHILGLPDRDRTKRLLSELRRALRKAGVKLYCIWARDDCRQRGLHIHLALHWPLSLERLVALLARLTGSQAEPEPKGRAVLAHSECGGWQIKRNIAQDEIRSAARWTGYLLDQETRHLVMPRLEGRIIGVSRTLSPRAIAPYREALEAWKVRVGWQVGDAPSDGLSQHAERRP